MIMILTSDSISERSAMLRRWINIANELLGNIGNLHSFCSIMEALTSTQIQRLPDTWIVLQQYHVTDSRLFESKLLPTFYSIQDGTNIFCSNNITLPNLAIVVQLLQRTVDNSLMTWEERNNLHGLETILLHLEAARVIASQASTYRKAALEVMDDVAKDTELEAVFRTEFLMRLMWGSKGAKARSEERVRKFRQLLFALLDRLQPTVDVGTEC